MIIKKEIDDRIKETELIVRTWSEDEYQKILEKFDTRLSITTTEGIVRIDKAELYYVEALRNYAELHTIDQTYTVRSPLYKINDLLGANFIQVSRSYLINFDLLDSVETDFVNGIVARVGKYKIPISRKGLKAIDKKIWEESR